MHRLQNGLPPAEKSRGKLEPQPRPFGAAGRGTDHQSEQENESPRPPQPQAGAAREKSLFWYGFGQGALHFLAVLNPALGVEMGAQNSAVGGITCLGEPAATGQGRPDRRRTRHQAYSGETRQTLLKQGYTERDVEMLQRAGVPETELRRIWAAGARTAGTSAATGLAPTYDATYYVNDILAENTELLTLSSRCFGDGELYLRQRAALCRWDRRSKHPICTTAGAVWWKCCKSLKW